MQLDISKEQIIEEFNQNIIVWSRIEIKHNSVTEEGMQARTLMRNVNGSSILKTIKAEYIKLRNLLEIMMYHWLVCID